MRYLIVYNLAAGTPSNAIFEFERALVADGDECVLRATDGTTDVESLLTDAAGFDAVIIAGGDGTAASALHAMRDTGVPVLHFPAGTSNLLSLNLDSPSEPVALAKLVREGRTLPFDLAELTFENWAPKPGEATGSARWHDTVGFDIIAGAGFDAAIMERAVGLKPTLGPAAYFAAALAEVRPTVSHLVIEHDGEVTECDGIAVLLVNFGKIAEGIALTPSNDPRDGLFEVVVIKAQNAAMLLPAIVASFLGREGEFLERSDIAQVFKAREVRVTADPPLTIQFDGEPTGITTPFSARVLPGAVNLIVTEQEYKRAQG